MNAKSAGTRAISHCRCLRSRPEAKTKREAGAPRKKVYVGSHPETKQGGAPGKAGGGKAKVANLAGFVTSTSSLTGKPERTIRRDVTRGERLGPDIEHQPRQRCRDRRPRLAPRSSRASPVVNWPTGPVTPLLRPPGAVGRHDRDDAVPVAKRSFDACHRKQFRQNPMVGFDRNCL
jgi:hypothetical protein